jgi:hypothetical protein
MFTLISYSDAGYSLIHQSGDFQELENIQQDPSILNLDGLLLNDNLLSLGGICGSLSMGDGDDFEDVTGFEENSHLFILDQEFIEYLKSCEEDSEDLELCEMLMTQYPDPHMLKDTLHCNIAA